MDELTSESGQVKVNSNAAILTRSRIHQVGVAEIKIGGQINEISNGDVAIVIEVTVLPRPATGVEIRCQINEVGDGDSAGNTPTTAMPRSNDEDPAWWGI